MEVKDIEKIQKVIKNDIRKSLRKGKVEKAIRLIDCFADTTQRINNILRDDDIEDALRELSDKYIDSSIDITDGDKNTIVMYDQIGTTACLGVQYLRGLAACGYKIIYIYEDYNFMSAISTGMLGEVKKYCLEFYEFNSHCVYQNGKFLGNTIRDIIIRANPSKIIMHPQGVGALGMAILFSIKGARKYRIVPGDHHFYIGYDCFDRFIEFRSLGCSSAIYERKIPAEKIYKLSYYPIIDEFVPFQGFPEGTKGKVIIGSGGAIYKFQGSDIFYNILESILSRTKNSVFVFMGVPSEQLLKLSKKDCIKGKVFLLGYRKDFAAVMKHIDILFNSYPLSGGLFCQTAARFAKPILAYSPESSRSENAVENILGKAKNGEQITISNTEKLVEHAVKLIESRSYRKEWGELAHSIQQTPENFNNQLNNILNEEYPTLDGKCVEYFDRTSKIEHYISIRKTGNPDYLMPISRVYKFSVFYRFLFLRYDILHNIKFVLLNIFSRYLFLRRLAIRITGKNVEALKFNM